jgi:pyrroloquinoline quinone biosynthesis protein B
MKSRPRGDNMCFKEIVSTFLIAALAIALQVELSTAEGGKSGAPFVVVLGVAQDGGYPQAGCQKACCTRAWDDPAKRRHVSCVAIVDPQTSQRWIIDATPDFRDQLRLLDQVSPVAERPGITGIFLTHAHMGHYTGLAHLGREVMGTKGIPVYAMPRMEAYLRGNGPWDQLVRLENIVIRPLRDGVPVSLNDRLTITPFVVPHRDEYTETVGYRIVGPAGSVIYISDIDKWERWDESIVEMVSQASRAYVDATFCADGEIPGRSMADIPHPFIEETMQLFEGVPHTDKAKIRFIHMNHTNPAIDPNSKARKRIEASGFGVADELEIFEL